MLSIDNQINKTFSMFFDVKERPFVLFCFIFVFLLFFFLFVFFKIQKKKTEVKPCDDL